MRNIRSIYLACTNVCNLVIVFATLFYLFFALFYCYSLSGVQLKELGLSQTVVDFFLLQIKIRVLVQDVQYICSKDFILDSLKNCFLIIPSVTMIFFGIMFSIVQQIPLMFKDIQIPHISAEPQFPFQCQGKHPSNAAPTSEVFWQDKNPHKPKLTKYF